MDGNLLGVKSLWITKKVEKDFFNFLLKLVVKAQAA